MKRQKETIGAILEINIENEYFVYAQILDGGTAFFDYKTKENLKDFTILNSSKILFIIAVYKDVITHGIWLKVGKLQIREELRVLPFQYIRDPLKPENFELYNPNTGEITKSTKDEVKGLECAAVWEANHVEDRIRDHYLGVPCIWMEGMTVE